MRPLSRAALTALLTMAPASGVLGQTYRVSLTNLTAGQPFSPYVFATHDATETVWQPGQSASPGLRQIAEEGDNRVLLDDLGSVVGGGIGSLTSGAAPLLPGGSTSFLLSTDSAHPLLSSAWMLGWTNDGFAGLNEFDLHSVTDTITLDLLAYDAGTEVNNESAPYLAALGGVFNDPENGVIGLHPGIVGNADIPLARGWTGAVARLQITAVPEPNALAMLGSVVCTAGLFVRRRRHA